MPKPAAGRGGGACGDLSGGRAAGAFALTRRLVGNRAVAEDLFQDTMMVLFQRLGDFRGEAPLGIWLRQIAVTRCLMYLRSPWHRARLQWESGDDDSLHPSMLPITPATSADALDVERALASLTPVARAVVWLFEVEGYSHEEIARLVWTLCELLEVTACARVGTPAPGLGPAGGSRGMHTDLDEKNIARRLRAAGDEIERGAVRLG